MRSIARTSHIRLLKCAAQAEWTQWMNARSHRYCTTKRENWTFSDMWLRPSQLIHAAASTLAAWCRPNTTTTTTNAEYANRTTNSTPPQTIIFLSLRWYSSFVTFFFLLRVDWFSLSLLLQLQLQRQAKQQMCIEIHAVGSAMRMKFSEWSAWNFSLLNENHRVNRFISENLRPTYVWCISHDHWLWRFAVLFERQVNCFCALYDVLKPVTGISLKTISHSHNQPTDTRTKESRRRRKRKMNDKSNTFGRGKMVKHEHYYRNGWFASDFKKPDDIDLLLRSRPAVPTRNH